MAHDQLGQPAELAQQTPGAASGSPTGVGSETQPEDLLGLLTCVHAGQGPHAGLRLLAEQFVYAVLGLLFPHFAARPGADRGELATELAGVRRLLEQALAVLGLPDEREAARTEVLDRFCGALGEIREALLLDAGAIFEGDPAAVSVDEVILAYPGFFAIATYRIAHALQGPVVIFPRLLTEVAHRVTGVDIHPGAQIGASFAIDHGTGIVIGETAVLGSHVRLYQGVTLGAAHVSKHLERTKRHPTIGDDVVIYANATILGGETTIGRGSRIGGNVWLTRSVPPYSVVTPTACDWRDGEASSSDDLIEFNI